MTIDLRTGLRLEQITAKLETLPLDMDPHDFYDLVKEPPQSLIDDYPWLKKALADAPKGASLEGFLWPGSYNVLPDTTPEELVRQMLDRFVADVGPARMDVAADRGLSFYQVLALASIVEREAVLDDDRAKIAGVYQNRIDGIPGVKNRQLNADPTVFYAIDTMELDKLDFADWRNYKFWTPPGVPLKDVEVTPELEGYQTYTERGADPRADRHPDGRLDRRGARAGHEGQEHLLRGHPRRRRRARVREDGEGVRQAAHRVRLPVSVGPGA